MASTTSDKVYLVSGANRGLGLGLVTELAARQNVTIYAGCRDPAKAEELKTLQQKHNSVHIIKLVNADVKNNQEALAQIEKEAGKLDVIIANAGLSHGDGLLAQVPLDNIREQFEVNTMGMIVLYQSAHKLLTQNANKQTIFVYVSSGIGSIGGGGPFQAAGYGISKAAGNWALKRISIENKDMIAFALHPGWVATDMGNAGAAGIGMKAAPTSIKDSVNGMLGLIDNATTESSGKFFNAVRSNGGNMWDVPDETIPW